MPTTPPLSFSWDKHSLYELCAQNPPRDAKLLRAIHADGVAAPRSTLILGEDFCGTAALSRAWCDLLPRGRAIGVDIDEPTIQVARERSGGRDRMTLIRADVRRVREKVDLIAVLNFSVGEIHDRAALVRYFKHARSRLKPRGCFICDIYGGTDAFEPGLLDQPIKPPPKPHPGSRDKILYSWEQRSANPLTGRVVNAMHFEVVPRDVAVPPRQPVRASTDGRHGLSPKAATSRGTGSPQVFLNAFVYTWRLWSVPELRDAMLDAGFTSTSVYPRTAGAIDHEGNLHTQPVEDPAEVGDSFNVFIAGR
jgi:SAM-dependent methyltransferase